MSPLWAHRPCETPLQGWASLAALEMLPSEGWAVEDVFRGQHCPRERRPCSCRTQSPIGGTVSSALGTLSAKAHRLREPPRLTGLRDALCLASHPAQPSVAAPSGVHLAVQRRRGLGVRRGVGVGGGAETGG